MCYIRIFNLVDPSLCHADVRTCLALPCRALDVGYQINTSNSTLGRSPTINGAVELVDRGQDSEYCYEVNHDLPGVLTFRP
jgi:hypothetical protein